MPDFSRHLPPHMPLQGAVLLSLVGVLSLDGIEQMLLTLLHFALFLLWQPIWALRQSINPRSLIVLLILFGLLIPSSSNHLFEVVWVLFLAGIVGGNHTQNSTERWFGVWSFLILSLLLLLQVVPDLARVRAFSEEIREQFIWILVLFCLPLMAYWKDDKASDRPIDIFYAFSVVLLLLILVLGSLAYTFVSHDELNYAIAVLHTSLTLGAGSLLLAWLWLPSSQFSGLSALWTRYLLNNNLSSDRWLPRVHELAMQSGRHPDDVIVASLGIFFELTYVRGIAWSIDGKENHLGEVDGRDCITLESQGLYACVYTAYPLGTSAQIQLRLLFDIVQLLITAKLNEQQLAHQAVMRGIYETGAKLTHDMKNILQATHNMVAVANSANGSNAQQALAIIQQQLPALQERLENTLKKLSAPSPSPDWREESSQQWFKALIVRYKGRDIDFNYDSNTDVSLPLDLFDTVAENLLENARFKRINDRTLNIECRFTTDEEQYPCLTIEDSGQAIPNEVLNQLFARPISSRQGLGVGLYQCARMAQEGNYHLVLTENHDGMVRFVLCPQISPASE